MKTNYTWTQETPWGALKISATSDGVHSVRLRSGTSRQALDPTAPGEVGEFARAFRRFFAGETEALDGVKVDLSSVDNDFQRKVLTTLRTRIGPGKTISYGELAEAVGHPGAARAVGTAMAQNPVPIVVPCHRVLAAGGKLGGYGGGLEMKRGLLQLEGATEAGELFTRSATA
ncbi:MAG TPA: MGMT family protein [Actinomycetota bacterium]|jgi:methylated-DNA-[protein]-cysteine S-methyltransferase|nr:MGMT family protein [Actinomycetota bacterium]